MGSLKTGSGYAAVLIYQAGRWRGYLAAYRARTAGRANTAIGAIIGYARNDPEVQSYVNAFDQGLRELGWTEGRNAILNQSGHPTPNTSPLSLC